MWKGSGALTGLPKRLVVEARPPDFECVPLVALELFVDVNYSQMLVL